MIDNGIRWHLTLALFFLLLLIGSAFYILFPHALQVQNNQNSAIVYANPPSVELNSDIRDIQNWKTYKNYMYNFSFSYPEELEVLESGPTIDVTASHNLAGSGSTTAIKTHITIDAPVYDFNKLYNESEGYTLELSDRAKMRKVKNILFKGYKGLEYVYETSLGDQKKPYISYGTMIQQNTHIMDVNSWSNDTSIYKDILSTIVFK